MEAGCRKIALWPVSLRPLVTDDWLTGRRQRTSGSHPEAREASIRMFEEAHLSPPSDQQLALLFTKFSVNGRLVFKEKLKSLDAVHMVSWQGLASRAGLGWGCCIDC